MIYILRPDLVLVNLIGTPNPYLTNWQQFTLIQIQDSGLQTPCLPLRSPQERQAGNLPLHNQLKPFSMHIHDLYRRIFAQCFS